MGYRTPYHTSLSARVIRTNSSRHSGTLINFLPNPSYFLWLQNLISLHPVTSFSLVTCNFVSNLHFHFYYIISKKIGTLLPLRHFRKFLKSDLPAVSAALHFYKLKLLEKAKKDICLLKVSILSNTDIQLLRLSTVYLVNFCRRVSCTCNQVYSQLPFTVLCFFSKISWGFSSNKSTNFWQNNKKPDQIFNSSNFSDLVIKIYHKCPPNLWIYWLEIYLNDVLVRRWFELKKFITNEFSKD